MSCRYRGVLELDYEQVCSTGECRWNRSALPARAGAMSQFFLRFLPATTIAMIAVKIRNCTGHQTDVRNVPADAVGKLSWPGQNPQMKIPMRVAISWMGHRGKIQWGSFGSSHGGRLSLEMLCDIWPQHSFIADERDLSPALGVRSASRPLTTARCRPCGAAARRRRASRGSVWPGPGAARPTEPSPPTPHPGSCAPRP